MVALGQLLIERGGDLEGGLSYLKQALTLLEETGANPADADYVRQLLGSVV